MKIAYTSSTQEPNWENIPDIDFKEQKCLHESCLECGGTGIKKNGLGMCVHMISCPCPKCTPRC